jgi:hypothetical protein
MKDKTWIPVRLAKEWAKTTESIKTLCVSRKETITKLKQITNVSTEEREAIENAIRLLKAGK